MQAIVYFGPSKNWLLNKLLPDEFQHCYMVVYSQEQRIVVDPTVDGLEIFVSDNHHRPYSRYVRCTPHPIKNFGLLGVHSCVSYIKRMLGINKWWIITPRQLYKELTNGNV